MVLAQTHTGMVHTFRHEWYNLIKSIEANSGSVSEIKFSLKILPSKENHDTGSLTSWNDKSLIKMKI